MNSDSNTEPDADPNAESEDGLNRKGSPDPESLLDRLATGGVLAAKEDSGNLVLTDEFLDLVTDSRRTVSAVGEEGRDADTLNLPGGRDRDPFNRLLETTDNEDLAAEYLALVRADIDGFTHEDRLRSLPLLDALRDGVPNEGSPDPFVPIRGPSLPALLPLYERAIVYTWREDCPPCDVMRDAFEAVFETPPRDIALFSVYGPDNAELLYEHYDVVGGPTTLFCYQGSVDARLTGAYAEQIVEREVRKLREVDPSAADS